MDFLHEPANIMSIASLILLMLLNTHRTLSLSISKSVEEDFIAEDIVQLGNFDALRLGNFDVSSSDVDVATRATLQHFQLFNSLAAVDEDLGFWVKPRSTTWFTKFLMEEYDDSRWIQMFRMTKRSVLSLAQLLSPVVKKKDTKYRLAIPVTVRVACTLFKLSHGASLLICSELFAVGRSTVSIMLRQVVHAINVALRNEISWPRGEQLLSVAANFQQLCSLPGVVGAIDGTHIAIAKPSFGSADYYYFKSGGYSMNCQAVVDSSKRFLDLYVGMPGSTNDSRMLRRSTLYYRAQRNTLWDANATFNGFSPYLLGDGGYPLLPWLMVPNRQQGQLSLADSLFNRKLSRGHAVVENAFGLLKMTFRELHKKTDLHVKFVPDVVTCCAILHNVLLKQSHEDVERLLDVLRAEDQERLMEELRPDMDATEDGGLVEVEPAEGQLKRRQLAVFLSLQRVLHQ